MSGSRGSLLWRVGDLIAVYIANALCAIGILTAWWGVSGTAKFSAQAAWTSLGAAALILAGTGNTIWLLSGWRAIGERQLRGFLGMTPTTRGAPQAAPNTDLPVAAEAMTRYHRPGCALATGKHVRPANASRHERAGRRPCGVCNP